MSCYQKKFTFFTALNAIYPHYNLQNKKRFWYHLDGKMMSKAQATLYRAVCTILPDYKVEQNARNIISSYNALDRKLRFIEFDVSNRLY
jgi:hypothetical protein